MCVKCSLEYQGATCQGVYHPWCWYLRHSCKVVPVSSPATAPFLSIRLLLFIFMDDGFLRLQAPVACPGTILWLEVQAHTLEVVDDPTPFATLPPHDHRRRSGGNPLVTSPTKIICLRGQLELFGLGKGGWNVCKVLRHRGIKRCGWGGKRGLPVLPLSSPPTKFTVIEILMLKVCTPPSSLEQNGPWGLPEGIQGLSYG